MVRWSLRTSIALCIVVLAPWQAALAQQTAYPQPPPPEEEAPAAYQLPAAVQAPAPAVQSDTTVEPYVPPTAAAPGLLPQYAPPSPRYGLALSPEDNVRLYRVERRRILGEVLTVIGALSAVAAIGVAGYQAFCFIDCRRGLGGAIIGITAGVAVPTLAVGVSLIRSAKRTERNILQPVRRTLTLAPSSVPGGGRFVLSGTF